MIIDSLTKPLDLIAFKQFMKYLDLIIKVEAAKKAK